MDGVMYFLRIAVALIAVSVGVVAQTAHGNLPFCPLTPKDKNPFLSLMAVESASSSTHQNVINFTRVTPPLEFRRHRLKAKAAVSPRASIWLPEPPLWTPDECQSAHTDVGRSIH